MISIFAEVSMNGVEVLCQDDPLLVVPPLVQHLPFKVQQVSLPRSDEQANKFVIDAVVNLRIQYSIAIHQIG